MQMRQRDVAALGLKYTKELADAKAENDALRDVAAGRRRLHIEAVCRSVREARHRLRRGCATSRLADTAERDYFTLRERLIAQQKPWKEPKPVNEQCRCGCPYRWATHAMCEQYTRASMV